MMGDLILDVLRLHTFKLERSKNPTFVMTDLTGILLKCIEDLQPIATKKNISFDSNIEPVQTKCIPLQVQMLLNNLLSNAINYSHPEGKIVVSCSNELQSGCPVVTISDNGIGIDAEKLPHIFDEFFRTKEAMKHNRASTGIGLAIVKHVAQSHNIRISVESEQNLGTTFTLYFPPG